MTQLLKFFCRRAICVGVLAGCSSTATINSTPSADIMALSPDYSIEANMGEGPIDVDSQNNLERYQFFRAGQPDEYLLLLFPEQLDGELKIGLGEGTETTASPVFGTYFDLLLRAHRMLLSGDLLGAQTTIERLEASYDEGYGSVVLKANLAVVRGELDLAARHFEVANQLLPGNEAITNLIPNDENSEDTGN